MTHAEYMENLKNIRKQKRREYAKMHPPDDPRCTAVRNELRADIRAWKKQKGITPPTLSGDARADGGVDNRSNIE